MKIIEPSVKILWSTPQAESMIEAAGRTCYKSEPRVFKDCDNCFGTGLVKQFIPDVGEDNGPEGHYVELQCHACNQRSSKEFIRKIISLGHESVLEHSVISLRVVCDRGVSHEFVRSRIGISYSQESTRYCNYSSEKFNNEITVICPSYLNKEEFDGPGDFGAFQDWKEVCLLAEKNYNHMVNDCKISPQVARSILPTCLKTEIAVTANIRAWRHFLKQRLSPKAHPDMQILAKLIYQELIKICPNCFFDINIDAK